MRHATPLFFTNRPFFVKLEELVGQHLMIGVAGTEVTPEMLDLFRKTHAGGLIVFRPNFKSAGAFKKLISGLEDALGRKLLVAVDHEGGRVIHLAEGVSVFPDNLAFGQIQNEKIVEEQGTIEGLELRRLGIDVNLAPTIDVLTESFSPNIGIRSYGKDPDLVAKLGAARIRAMQAAGLSACAKHFPGQGQSQLDAHLDLPVLFTTSSEMKKVHLVPFVEAIKAGVDTVMSSHPIYPNLDHERKPATFSRVLMHDLLRQELGFKGVVFSDDLEMGALKNICPIGESACRAVAAGHDVVLVCHKAEAVLEVYQNLLEAYQNNVLDIGQLEKSVARITALKNKRSKRFAEGRIFSEKEGSLLSRDVAICAVNIFKNKNLLPIDLSSHISIVFPRLSSLASLIFIEKDFLDEKKILKSCFEKKGAKISSIDIVGLDPSAEEIQKTLENAKKSDLAVFFCYDAHLYPKTRELLEKIQQTAKTCAVILLRDPYDEEWVSEKSIGLSVFGFRSSQIEAAIESLFDKTSI